MAQITPMYFSQTDGSPAAMAVTDTLLAAGLDATGTLSIGVDAGTTAVALGHAGIAVTVTGRVAAGAAGFIGIRTGAGTPEGSVTADTGDTYFDTTGNALYVKEGNGTNTGWVNVGTSGSMTSFTLAGTSGTPQTISDGDTVTVAAGTGITTTAGATDTVTIAVDSTVVVTSGNQTINGIKTFGSFPVTPSADPTTDYQVANKKYVDDIAAYGITWKKPALVLHMISDTDQSGAPPVGPTAGDAYVANNWGGGYTDDHIYEWDGVSAWVDITGGVIATGDRVIVAPSGAAGSFAAKANQIMEYNGATWTEPDGTSTDGWGILINGDGGYYHNDAFVYDDTSKWTQISGLGNVTAGDGLTKTGNTLDVNVGDGIQIATDAVAIKLDTNSGLNVSGTGLTIDFATVTGNGLTYSGEVMAVQAVADHGIDVTASGIEIDASDIAGAGLVENGSSTWLLDVNVGDGIQIATDAVAIKLDTNPGLDVSGTGLTIDFATVTGNGLTYSGETMAVQAVASQGIDVGASGISVAGADIAGDGLVVNGSNAWQVDINVGTGAASGGLEIATDVLKVKIGAGLDFNVTTGALEVDSSEFDASKEIALAAGTISDRDVICIGSAGTVTLADADSLTLSRAISIADGAYTVGQTVKGFMPGQTITGLTAKTGDIPTLGDPVYLSDTAGQIQATPPGTGKNVVYLGDAVGVAGAVIDIYYMPQFLVKKP